MSIVAPLCHWPNVKEKTTFEAAWVPDFTCPHVLFHDPGRRPALALNSYADVGLHTLACRRLEQRLSGPYAAVLPGEEPVARVRQLRGRRVRGAVDREERLSVAATVEVVRFRVRPRRQARRGDPFSVRHP